MKDRNSKALDEDFTGNIIGITPRILFTLVNDSIYYISDSDYERW